MFRKTFERCIFEEIRRRQGKAELSIHVRRKRRHADRVETEVAKFRIDVEAFRIDFQNARSDTRHELQSTLEPIRIAKAHRVPLRRTGRLMLRCHRPADKIFEPDRQIATVIADIDCGPAFSGPDNSPH